MRYKIVVLLTLFTLLIKAQNITVAVATNVSFAIEELQKRFKLLYPDITVQTILGSTGKLTAQIENGAPYDILMAADMAYPNALYKNSFAVTKPKVYAQGSLALLTTKALNLSTGIRVLQSAKVHKIAIANPKTAPYGKASLEALKSAKIYNSIKGKLVYAQGVSQTAIYATKAADIGFIAKSSLYAPQMLQYKEGKNWVDVDSRLYTPIKQGIVILQHARKSEAATAFYNFIFSQKAKDIFKKYGYSVQ